MYALGMILPVLTTYYILLKLFDGVYERKYSKSVYATAYILITVLHCFTASLKIPLLSLMVFVIFVVLMSGFGYTSRYNKIVCTSLFMVYLTFIDMVIVPAFAEILHMTVKQTMEDSKVYFLTGMAGVIIELGTYRWIIRLFTRCRVQRNGKKKELFIGGIVCFEIGVLHMLLKLKDYSLSEMNVIIVVLGIGFVGVDAYLLSLFKDISGERELKMQMYLYEQEAAENEKYVEQIETQNENYRGILHDVKKHIRMMQDLKVADETYGDEVLELIKWKGQSFKCSNHVLCCLLNDRLRMCEEKDIETELDIDDINLDFMKKTDITVIFTNLLDNAIEACEEVENGIIKISMREVQGNLIVVIENSYKEEKNVREEKSIRKSEHMGMGLVNVKEALSKYDSKLEIEKDGVWFKVKFVLWRLG